MKSLGLALLAIVAVGCGSKDAVPAETKPGDVAPQLTPEQQKYVDANKSTHFSNPKKKR